jgi:hypothetical protein
MEISGGDAAGFQRELDAHRQALSDFVETAGNLDPPTWNEARPNGGWSPAQIAEHLRLSYLTVRADLSDTGGFRVRTAWWQQRLFRFLYLAAILDKGRFPRGVPSTSEVRPGDGPYDRQALLGSLGEEGEAFLDKLRAATMDSGRGLTHPFLGKLGLLDGLRFMTRHVQHHHRQLGESSGAGPVSSVR